MHCPLELRMGTASRRERFAVPEGAEKTFNYQTAARVDQVIIDPELTAYQVDVTDPESLLRIESATRASQWEWLHYWLGVAFGNLNRNREAEKHLTFAVAAHEKRDKGKANPAFYFSRGIVFLHQNQPAKATEDIRYFLQGIFAWGANDGFQAVLGRLLYAGLVSDHDGEQQLQRTLKLLTCEDLALDPKLQAWNQWWMARQQTFQLNPRATGLTPGGLGTAK